ADRVGVSIHSPCRRVIGVAIIVAKATDLDDEGVPSWVKRGAGGLRARGIAYDFGRSLLGCAHSAFAVQAVGHRTVSGHTAQRLKGTIRGVAGGRVVVSP